MTEHLADGWEPGLETDTLLRAGTEVWLADAVPVAEAMGGRVDDGGRVVLVDSGYPSLFSAAAFLRGPVPVDEIAGALDWFTGVHAVISPVPTPDLTPIGLRLIGHPPRMVRAAGGAPPPSTAHAVEQVADADGRFYVGRDADGRVVATSGADVHGVLPV